MWIEGTQKNFLKSKIRYHEPLLEYKIHVTPRKTYLYGLKKYTKNYSKIKYLDNNNHHYYKHVIWPFGKDILCAPKEYQKNTLKLKIAILRNIIRIHMLRDHKKKYILCGPK